jgi:hypothetical protein
LKIEFSILLRLRCKDYAVKLIIFAVSTFFKEMKKIGAVTDFKEMRDRELTDAFRRLLREGVGSSLHELFELAAKQPASRFWVSEHRAAIVIRDMLYRGEDLRGMKEQSQRMYREIYRRVRAALRKDPGRCVYHLVFEVVNSPAPEFYLTAETAKVLIYAHRRKRRRAEE